MAESLKKLKELFDLKDADLRTYSPLTLAYIGDGVYELVIRTILVRRKKCISKRKECAFRYHGQTCHHGGLPACHRV